MQRAFDAAKVLTDWADLYRGLLGSLGHLVADAAIPDAHAIPPELIGRIAPTHIEGINLRGVFRFPIEHYAEQLLPSSLSEKTPQWGQ